MSLEDEVVLADIEVAGRLLTDSIARDSRFASCDLQDALDAARFSSHPYSTPPKEVRLLASCHKRVAFAAFCPKFPLERRVPAASHARATGVRGSSSFDYQVLWIKVTTWMHWGNSRLRCSRWELALARACSASVLEGRFRSPEFYDSFFSVRGCLRAPEVGRA